MAQNYLPAIKDGDKRVLVVDGEPVPYCLARIPQGGNDRGNLAAGGPWRSAPAGRKRLGHRPPRGPDAEGQRLNLSSVWTSSAIA